MGERDIQVIGDSFAVGIGATNRFRDGYASHLARLLDGYVHVVAAGGTGFLNAGPKKFGLIHRGTHIDRARRVRRRRDLLLIQASPNDRFFTPDQIITAMGQYMDRIGDTSPVAVIGPTWAVTREDLFANVEDASRTFAAGRGYTYVDMSPLRAERARFVIADGMHLNDDGHRAFAERVAETLRGKGDSL